MKHGKKPTLNQKILLKSRGLNPDNWLVIRTAQGTLQPGWLATQSDMLADDWMIVG